MLFWSRNITRLARWRGWPQLHALLHRSAIKLDFSISQYRNSVLILCTILVAVFFFFGQGSTSNSFFIKCLFYSSYHMPSSYAMNNCNPRTRNCPVQELIEFFKLHNTSLTPILPDRKLTMTPWVSSTLKSWRGSWISGEKSNKFHNNNQSRRDEPPNHLVLHPAPGEVFNVTLYVVDELMNRDRAHMCITWTVSSSEVAWERKPGKKKKEEEEKKIVKFGQRLFTAHPHVARYILFETRTGDEKDDNNSLQRFGVLHLLQREE